MSELLSLEIEAGNAGTTVRVAGEIDLETAPRLRECFALLPGDVVVDLSEVSFVDSQAIGLLVAEHKRRVAVGERLAVTGSSTSEGWCEIESRVKVTVGSQRSRP